MFIFYGIQNGRVTRIKTLFFYSGNNILRFLYTKEETPFNTCLISIIHQVHRWKGIFKGWLNVDKVLAVQSGIV